MKRARSGWPSVLLALALAGCSSAPVPAGFPAQPIQTLGSRSKRLTVQVRTSPQPPTRGSGQSAEYTITDASTVRPVSGLALAVVPWMPVMAHGSSVVPSVTETAPGTYVVTNVSMAMPGQWELRTTITWPSLDAGVGASDTPDYVSPAFEIP